MCQILNKTFETAPAGRQPPKIFYNAVAMEQGVDTANRLVYYRTAFGTIAQLDRASDSGSEGRRFESA